MSYTTILAVGLILGFVVGGALLIHAIVGQTLLGDDQHKQKIRTTTQHPVDQQRH